MERLALSAAFASPTISSPREKAALAWTEEVTLINQTAPSEESYQTLLKHFGEEGMILRDIDGHLDLCRLSLPRQ